MIDTSLTCATFYDVLGTDCWIEVVSGSKTSEVGFMKFDRNPDKATREKYPFIFDRFDSLISILEMRGCRLGFSKVWHQRLKP